MMIHFGIVAAVHLVLAISYGIPTMISAMFNSWFVVLALCFMIAAFTLMIQHTIVFLVFAFSLDKYLTISFPLTYPKHSLKVLAVLSLIAWTISINFILNNILLGYFSSYKHTLFDLIDFNFSIVCQAIYFLFFFIAVAAALIVPAVFFIALYLKGRRLPQADKDLGIDKHWRAIRTSLLIFVTVVALQFISIIPLILAGFFQTVGKIMANTVGADYILLNIFTNPILLRNTAMKEAKKAMEESLKNYDRNRLQRNRVIASQ